MAAPDISYAGSPASIKVHVPMDALTMTNVGGAAVSVALAPGSKPLPTGVTVASPSGTISGTFAP